MIPSGETPQPSAAATATVRLFPLPDLVMFPHVIQPLHVFEPRYCDLLEDALAGDRSIALVTLEPGFESEYEARPPILPVACVTKIVAHERLPSGRHNILVRGLRRVAIRQELPPTLSFRQAEVETLEDFYPAAAPRRADVQRRILELARVLLPDSETLHEQLDDLLAGESSLGMLTDVFAFTLGFASSIKQSLLLECNVDRRADMLEERLAELARHVQSSAGGPVTDFPPRFSLN